jgi:hypothetical protein
VIESYLSVYLSTMLYLASMDSISKWNSLMTALKKKGRQSWLRYQLNHQLSKNRKPGNVTKGYDYEGRVPDFKPLLIEGNHNLACSQFINQFETLFLLYRTTVPIGIGSVGVSQRSKVIWY